MMAKTYQEKAGSKKEKKEPVKGAVQTKPSGSKSDPADPKKLDLEAERKVIADVLEKTKEHAQRNRIYGADNFRIKMDKKKEEYPAFVDGQPDTRPILYKLRMEPAELEKLLEPKAAKEEVLKALDFCLLRLHKAVVVGKSHDIFNGAFEKLPEHFKNVGKEIAASLLTATSSAGKSKAIGKEKKTKKAPDVASLPSLKRKHTAKTEADLNGKKSKIQEDGKCGKKQLKEEKVKLVDEKQQLEKTKKYLRKEEDEAEEKRNAEEEMVKGGEKKSAEEEEKLENLRKDFEEEKKKLEKVKNETEKEEEKLKKAGKEAEKEKRSWEEKKNKLAAEIVKLEKEKMAREEENERKAEEAKEQEEKLKLLIQSLMENKKEEQKKLEDVAKECEEARILAEELKETLAELKKKVEDEKESLQKRQMQNLLDDLVVEVIKMEEDELEKEMKLMMKDPKAWVELKPPEIVRIQETPEERAAKNRDQEKALELLEEQRTKMHR